MDENANEILAVSSGDVLATESPETDVLASGSQVDLSTLIDEDLGGVPVVMVADTTTVDAVAVGDNSGYQLPEYYVNYFTGVLDNIGDTEYLAFCTREYPYGNDYWVEHFRLVYDIEVVEGHAIQGNYPCVDIYRYSSTSNYYVENVTYQLSSVPSFSYGSFGLYSDLRKGVSHVETLTILFFLGFFAVYFVIRFMFNFVFGRKR